MQSRVLHRWTVLPLLHATDGQMPEKCEHSLLTHQVDMITDKGILDMEIRDLLSAHSFDGEATPIIMGSALTTLEGHGPDIGADKINELTGACDE